MGQVSTIQRVRETESSEERYVEERRHVGDTSAVQGQHLQLKGAIRPVWLLHVQGKSRLTVGGHRYQDLIAGPFGRAMALDELSDCFCPPIPADVRRHLPDGILGEKLHDPLHVVVLKGLDVIGEKLLCALVGYRLSTRLRVHLVQLSTSTLQAAVDRGNGQ